MKWFKHHTDSLEDPFIQELLDEFNHAGYMAYFGLIEIICKENKTDITGELEIKPKFLKRKLRLSINKLEEIFEFCQAKDKLKFDKTQTNVTKLAKFSEVLWCFHLPKIVEIKDNYTGYSSEVKGMTRTLKNRIKDRDGERCGYCGKPCYNSDLVIDHIIPFSRQGKTEEENLIVCCRSCNSKKRDKTMEEAGMKFFEESSKKLSNHKDKEKEVDKDKEKDKTFLSDSIEYRLAEFMFNEIVKNNPTHKKPDLQKWAKIFDLILRIDGKSEKEIAELIRWCQKDSFEMSNVLSPQKLRQRWDQLDMKKKRPPSQKFQSGPRAPEPDRL